MRTQLSNYLDNLTTGLLFLVALLTPIFFLPMATDALDTPKLYLLVGIVLIILPLKALQWLVLGRIYLTFTPLDIPLLVFLMLLYISTLLSLSKFNSFLGELPRLHGGVISWVVYILLFFIIVNHTRTRNKYYLMILGLVLGVVLASLGYLISFWTSRMESVPGWLESISHHSTLQGDALSILTILTAPILVALILKAEGIVTPILAFLGLSLVVTAFVLTGNYLVLLPLGLSTVYWLLTTGIKLDALPKLSPLRLQLLTLPLIIGSVIFALGITKDTSSLTQSDILSAWAILSKIPYSQFIPLFPALLIMITSIRILTSRSTQKEPIDTVITFAALTAVLSLIFFPILTSSFFILSSFLIALHAIQHKTPHLLIYSLPLRQLVLLAFLLIGAIGITGGIRVVRADLANAKGLGLSQKPQQAYIAFSEAVGFVPLSDLYQANLALSSFSYAQSIATTYQSESVDSPIRQRDESLIRSLLDESIVHSQKATELNSLNYQNFLLLGFLQSRMAKINPSSSLDAYQSYNHALEIESKSPDLPFQIASSYYSLGEYKLAAEFFQKAVERNKTWANAHYNLALTLKELGEVEKAKTELSIVLKLLNPDSIDFKAAEGVLEGLSIKPQESTQSATLNLPSEDQPTEEIIPAPISGRTLIKNGKPI